MRVAPPGAGRRRDPGAAAVRTLARMPDLVTPLDPDALSPGLRAQWEQAQRLGRPGLADFVRVMANAEPLFELYNTAYMASRTDNHLGARVTELVRLAIANTTSCRVCLAGRSPAAVAEGMDEALVESIPDSWPTPTWPTPRSRRPSGPPCASR